MEKLATLAFPEEVRSNAIMQTQLTDLCVETLQNKRVRHDFIKQAPAPAPPAPALTLAKDRQGI